MLYTKLNFQYKDRLYKRGKKISRMTKFITRLSVLSPWGHTNNKCRISFGVKWNKMKMAIGLGRRVGSN